jgi:pimeloyl-ACP methyl ester carboxylesterase
MNKVSKASGGVRTLMLVTVVAAAVILAGCATPVGVKQLDPKQVQLNLTRSVLSSDHVSAPTAQILNRAGLAEKFKAQPADVLAQLHKGFPTASRQDELFALSELSYLYASEDGPKIYFLTSAIYAYAFLFPRDAATAPDRFDPRVRVATDLYNRAIAEALSTADPRRVIVEERTYPLPFGEITININPDELNWGNFRLKDFVQAAELDVRGMRNRYRWPGIGAPLAAAVEPREGVNVTAYARIPPAIKVPVTAVLRLDDVEEGLKTGKLRGKLELYTTEEATSVTINGRTVPIEYELTSALAYTLEGAQGYKLELKGLLSGDLQLFKDEARFKDGVFLMAPYRKGLIPVVFVHGTASSPARWAQMFNELQNDRALWGRYQFWFFTYNTGNPIAYSAGLLSDGLKRVVAELDPEGKDPALRNMVVVGHSQGGLLTKFTVIDTGNAFWDNAFTVPIDELDVSSETRELLRRTLFYKPLPFVKTVIFVATPHGGSFVSTGIVSDLARKLITLPFRILDPFAEVFKQNPEAVAMRSMKDIPRSTDNMDPKSLFIKTLSPIPIAPAVDAHSIIAVKNLDAPKEKWNDGVVEYKSAHIDGAASELIVNSGHSTQDEAATIEEVRRILIEHLKDK